MDNRLIDLHLAKNHLRKLASGKTLQLTKSQIEQGAKEGLQHLPLKILHNHYKKLITNLRRGKGMRMNKSMFLDEGGDLLGALKATGRFFKPVVKAVLPPLGGLAGTVLSTGTLQPELVPIASVAGVELGRQIAKSLGDGLKKPKKGTEEMKARMARIRSMKKSGKKTIEIVEQPTAQPQVDVVIKSVDASVRNKRIPSSVSKLIGGVPPPVKGFHQKRDKKEHTVAGGSFNLI
jgi:hypothetical protein